MQNLREKETQLLGKMLTLTNSSSGLSSVDFNDQWKVLIYDQDCRDIISPLFSVNALRSKGVTLHMMMHTEREAVPDAPAVYFVRPTEANIKRIAEDCGKQLYRTVYINFVTRIDRPLMEKLAQELVATNSVSMVSKIYDQYLDIIPLEPHLFTLNIKDSFMLYNEASLSEAQIRKYMSRVATGLLSMVRVLGTLPVIRSPNGGAAEMLSQELCGMLRENISAKGPAPALFEECLVNDRSRPLMLVFDRACDLFPILQHNSTYQARSCPLINDLLDLKLNRVAVEVPDKEASAGGSKKKKTYDLNTQGDAFLQHHAGLPIHHVIEANLKELEEVSQREAALKARPSAASDYTTTSDSLEAKGRDLGEALEGLPELLLRKKSLDAHTNIMQAIMDKVKERSSHLFFDLEMAVLSSGGRPDRAAVMAFLRDGTKGNLKDKARLLALVAATSEASYNTKANNEEYDAALTAGCTSMALPPPQTAIDRSLAAVAFIRRMQSLSSPLSGGMLGGAGKGQTAIFSNILNAVVNRAVQFLSGEFTPYYVTRVVDNLSEGKTCPEAESFTYFDPRTNSSGMPATAVGHKYSDVIVFVLGGGCYSEYFNLQDFLKGKAASGGSGSNLRNIMYGTSEMVNGEQFMDQLERLATPSAAMNITPGGK